MLELCRNGKRFVFNINLYHVHQSSSIHHNYFWVRWGLSNWREDARLDFCRGRRKCPSSARDGGQAWFSCLKNSSKSPFLIWQAINKHEKNEQSLFIEDGCCWAFEDFFLAGVSKNDSLFMVIGSRRGVFLYISLSLMNVSHCFIPVFPICCILDTPSSSATTLVSRTVSSVPSSSNGLPRSSKTCTSDLTSLWNVAWKPYSAS